MLIQIDLPSTSFGTGISKTTNALASGQSSPIEIVSLLFRRLAVNSENYDVICSALEHDATIRVKTTIALLSVVFEFDDYAQRNSIIEF